MYAVVLFLLFMAGILWLILPRRAGEITESRVITIPARMPNATALCRHLGVAPERGIFRAILKDQPDGKLNAGEVACFRSHVALWREFLASHGHRPDATLLVLEDDAQPADDQGASMRELRARLAEVRGRRWDLVYFGRCWDMCSMERPISRHMTRVFWPGCTHAYAISVAGIRRALRAIVPMRNTIDRSLKASIRRGELVAYATTRNAFEQDRVAYVSELGHDRETLRKCID